MKNERKGPATYDLVIRGGRLLDPATNTDGLLDIAITGDRIAEIGPGIDVTKAARVIDAGGKVVTPGLIDLHAHVAGDLRKGIREDLMLLPDTAGVHAGVTTVVDGGSIGAYNAAGFVNFTVPQSRTRVLAFLNVGRLGVISNPEVRDETDFDHEASVAAILGCGDVICGVKFRMVSPAVPNIGIDLALAAKRIAGEARVPMMVHVGDIMGDHPRAGELTPQLLSEVLQAGDIVTHAFSFHVGALLDGDTLLPQAQDAQDRGVIFDIGVGRSNFSFKAARKILDQGFMPDTLSSDLTPMSQFAGPTHSLMECMGKVMSLGLTLEDVVRMTTVAPAKALGLAAEIGALAVGRVADVSVLDVVEGEWVFHDVTGGTHAGRQAVSPVTCVRAGEVMPIDYGPHPRGWLPETT
jgi:dihydroorotase